MPVLGPALNRRQSTSAHAKAAAAAAAIKGGSIVFNGSNQSFSLSSDSDFNFGAGDWTVEVYAYVVSTSSNTIADWRPSGVNGVYPNMTFNSSNKLCYRLNNSFVITGTTTITTNAWHHFAWSKSAGTIRQFVDGILDGNTYVDASNYTSGFLTIGKDTNANNNYFSGKMTNLRITKGQGLYVSNFGVSNAPLTVGTNTKLLLLAKTSGTALADSSGLNKTVTNSGTTWNSATPF